MKLIFDNTTELVEFLDVMANRAVRHYLDTCFGGDLHTDDPAPEGTDDPAPKGMEGADEEPKPNTTAGEQAPRRKRRTKAEMAAAVQIAQPEAQASAVADATVTAHGVTQADATLTDAEIARRAQELGEVDPAKHLNDARAFIAAHGLTAYLQTQQMAKVSENAVTYTSEERARHTAAMQLFEYMKTGEGTAAA